MKSSSVFLIIKLEDDAEKNSFIEFYKTFPREIKFVGAFNEDE